LQVVVDGRETAPASATPERYVDASGRPIPGATTRGGTAVAVPGLPAALVHVAHRYGRLPLATSLAPAIRLAGEGFPVDSRYALIAGLRASLLRAQPEAAELFLHEGRVPAVGHIVRQPGLADTLARLGREGRRGFYAGPVAQAIVATVNAAGGAWTADDLARYRVVEREPLRTRYRDATIVTVPLPSAGGAALVQTLAMLELFAPGDARAPGYAHLVIEALRRSFQDRARYLGDSDHAPVPFAALVDRRYLAGRAAGIDPEQATPSAALPAPDVWKAESGNTTHVSVVDAEGNRVAATLTINGVFGSGLVAGASGVLLNNEMDDFTVHADFGNLYRLRGGAANAIAPGKRPLSSMTPTFVEDARGVLVLGSPGGSRIVSQIVLAVLDHLHRAEVDLRAIAAAPRYHHQFLPDRLEIEPDGFGDAWRKAMTERGHRIEVAGRAWGNLQLVFQSADRRSARAASDPRGAGVAWY
jgi:gamma-glutamyltranspeptidase/glutathione hydrolase